MNYEWNICHNFCARIDRDGNDSDDDNDDDAVKYYNLKQ